MNDLENERATTFAANSSRIVAIELLPLCDLWLVATGVFGVLLL